MPRSATQRYLTGLGLLVAAVTTASLGAWYSSKEKEPAFLKDRELSVQLSTLSMVLPGTINKDNRSMEEICRDCADFCFPDNRFLSEYRVLINPDREAWKAYRDHKTHPSNRYLVVIMPNNPEGKYIPAKLLEWTSARATGKFMKEWFEQETPWLQNSIRLHNTEPLPEEFFDKK